MIGFCYKDVLVMRKQLGYYGVFLLIYGVLTVVGIFPADILAGLAVMVGVMAPLSSFSFDEHARWDKFAATTPGGKGDIVAGKYLFALLVSAAAAAFVLAFRMVLALVGLVPANPLELLLVTIICFGVTLLINGVLLPLMLKFGAEKSRTIFMGLFVVIFGGSMLMGKLLSGGGNPPAVPGWLMGALPVVGALVVVGGCVLSYCIARGIYEKKEL